MKYKIVILTETKNKSVFCIHIFNTEQLFFFNHILIELALLQKVVGKRR